MTTKDQVIAAHRGHPTWTCSDIATELGCLPEYVRATARRNSLRIPLRRSASPVVRITPPTFEALRDHAEVREITVSALAMRIIETIAREDLVGAVLDDEIRLTGCKVEAEASAA